MNNVHLGIGRSRTVFPEAMENKKELYIILFKGKRTIIRHISSPIEQLASTGSNKNTNLMD